MAGIDEAGGGSVAGPSLFAAASWVCSSGPLTEGGWRYPGGRPDEVLLHELVHSLRMALGLTLWYGWMPDDYDTVEAFYAILIANIYRYPKWPNFTLAADHFFCKSDLLDKDDVRFYAKYKEQIDSFVKHINTCTPLDRSRPSGAALTRSAAPLECRSSCKEHCSLMFSDPVEVALVRLASGSGLYGSHKRQQINCFRASAIRKV